MRVQVFVGGMLAALCVGTAAWAEEPTKIGFVNAAKVLELAPQAASAQQRLEKEFEPRKDSLLAKQNELKRLQDSLDRDGAIMTDAEKGKVERDVVALKRELRRGQEEYQQDLNFRRNEELEKLQKRVNEAIEVIGREGGFDLILYEGIAYASPRVDLTEQVINHLSADSPRDGKTQSSK